PDPSPPEYRGEGGPLRTNRENSMAKVQCPNPQCRKVSSFPDAHLGRKARCKNCNTLFTTVAIDSHAPTAEAPPSVAAQAGASTSVVTVVARRVGGPAARSSALGKETVLPPSA